MSAPSCSARILLPIKRYVETRQLDRELVPPDFWAVRPDSRVSIVAAQSMLDAAAERLRDQELGLKLGRLMCFGEGGPFDYAVRSAPTVRDAVEVAARYTRLVSDSFLIRFERWRRHAVIRLSETNWTRQGADFAIAAFYKVHLSDQISPALQLECWFPYAAPRDLAEYRSCFGHATLKFGAPFFAYAFDGAHEKTPMPGADSVLHSAHRERVDSLLAELSAARALKARLRRLMEEEIQQTRGVTVLHVARTLGMSRRTLSRRLEEEGTTFLNELDDTRRALAIGYVNDPETHLKEVAFRLGFSHGESFYRAFRRWTGETPLAYRKRALGL